MSTNRRPLDIVVALDPAKVLRTCTSFPMRRSFNPQEMELDVPEGLDLETLYDPVYLLAAYAAVLVDGELGLGNELSGLDWVEVIRSNVLGLVVCALSSRKADVREMASFLIAKTYAYIQVSPKPACSSLCASFCPDRSVLTSVSPVCVVQETMFQEQTQLLYTLNLLRHSCPTPAEGSTTPHRSPTVITLFFAQTLRSIGNPSSFVYPAASRFLLQRPEVDAGDVPLLYGMLYSSDEGWKQERSWIVRFLRDGMRSAEDWRILQRRHTFSLLASLFQSTPDAPIRRLILEVFANMTHNPTACVALVRREGFLSWIAIQIGLLQNEKTAAAAGSVEEAKGAVEVEMEEVWMRLVENVVVHMGAEDTKRAEEKTEDGAVKVGKASWRGEVGGLIARAVKGTSQSLFIFFTLPISNMGADSHSSSGFQRPSRPSTSAPPSPFDSRSSPRPSHLPPLPSLLFSPSSPTPSSTRSSPPLLPPLPPLPLCDRPFGRARRCSCPESRTRTRAVCGRERSRRCGGLHWRLEVERMGLEEG